MQLIEFMSVSSHGETRRHPLSHICVENFFQASRLLLSKTFCFKVFSFMSLLLITTIGCVAHKRVYPVYRKVISLPLSYRPCVGLQ